MMVYDYDYRSASNYRGSTRGGPSRESSVSERAQDLTQAITTLSFASSTSDHGKFSHDINMIVTIFDHNHHRRHHEELAYFCN
jgi:hypothetical protein